jgi:hypothetical protein
VTCVDKNARLVTSKTKVTHNTDAMAEGAPKTHVLDEAVLTTELYVQPTVRPVSTLGELLTMRSVQNVVNKYLDTADKSFRDAGAAFAAFPNPASPK